MVAPTFLSVCSLRGHSCPCFTAQKENRQEWLFHHRQERLCHRASGRRRRQGTAHLLVLQRLSHYAPLPPQRQAHHPPEEQRVGSGEHIVRAAQPARVHVRAIQSRGQAEEAVS